MSSNFNLVKKNKSEKKEVEDDYDLDEKSSSSSSSNDEAKSKMIKFMGVILVVVILLFVILYCASLFSKSTYTYTDIEKIMKDAAISYFKDYPESLPQNDGSIVEIDANNLIAAEKMKPFMEYLADETVACAGTVQVEKAGTDYLYTPYLNCGESYATTELYKKIVTPENIVTSGAGLYSNNGSYSYRGEEVNNYVKMGAGLWRIVKVTSNNNIVLISDEGTPYSQQWDNRYNEKMLYESGINNYSVSRIRDFLNKIYNNPSEKEEDGEYLITKKDKKYMIPYTLCVGKRDQNAEGKDNSLECAETIRDQMVGLLTLSDYLYASLDTSCKNATSKTCKNYNYLSKVTDWWLITADKNDNALVYEIDHSGKITSELAGSFSGVRPVIYLNSKVLYKSGDGTFEKPFKLK